MFWLGLLLACGGDKGGDSALGADSAPVPGAPDDSEAPTPPTTPTSQTTVEHTDHTGDTSDSADSGRTTGTTPDTGDTALPPPEVCGSGSDEDGDGDIDCADDDCACTAECFAGRIATSANLLVNGSFDLAEPAAGPLPDAAGGWVGDQARQADALDGAPPFDGAQIATLLATGPDGPADGTAQLVQVLDATDLRGDRLCVGAAVRRVAGDAETDTAFRLDAWSYLGAPADLPARWEALVATDCAATGSCATAEVAVGADAWVVLTGELYITPTPGTAAIAVRVAAVEDVVDDAAPPELDGHAVDAVWLFAP
ncbi:MAG: hypothetical protein ACI8PZ_001859 [Myxococcota bacterium]